jgi:glucose/arabinose dehydrogenase
MQRKHSPAASGPVLSLLVVLLVFTACGGGGEPTPVVPSSGEPTAAATLPAEEAASSTPPATETAAPSPTTPADTPTALPSPTRPAATATQAAPGGGTVPEDTVSAFPDPTGFTWAPVVSGLSSPVDLTSVPDGSGRLFVVEQPGLVRIVENGALLPTPFLDVRDRVESGGNEQGLLGLAIHPDYASNGFFYVNYTARQGGGDTVIARFAVSAGDPNLADPGSEKVLLGVDQPYRNHNGGGMAFGPDGYLYISLGDGGSANDPEGRAQSLDTLLGKLLRIDVDGGDPYAIPADNPFAGGGGEPEIWLYGLRNPWRFSFDRLTGDLYIADVGQGQWEEIDFLAAGAPGGANYGWDFREGAHPFEGEPPAGLELVDPIFEYQHGFGCSVTGGYVYRGQALPEWRGIYVLADYCSGRVWGLLRGADGAWQSQELFQSGFSITSFGEDQDGEVYLMDRSGTIYRLQGN